MIATKLKVKPVHKSRSNIDISNVLRVIGKIHDGESEKQSRISPPI